MHWLTKPGTSWPEMNRITIQASKELRTIPGVRNFGAHIGQALIMDEVVGVYFGENWISVDPAVDYDETLAKIQETVDGYPGLYRDVQTYLKERIREVLTGTSEAIAVRIYGRELDVLTAKSRMKSKRPLRRSTASSICTVVSGEDSPDRSQGRSGKGPAVRSQTGRCPPSGDHDGRRRGSRRHPHRQPHLRRARVEHTASPQQPDRYSRTCRSIPPTAATSAWQRWPTFASRRPRT